MLMWTDGVTSTFGCPTAPRKRFFAWSPRGMHNISPVIQRRMVRTRAVHGQIWGILMAMESRTLSDLDALTVVMGELVGQYKDESNVTYTQDTSKYYHDVNGFPSGYWSYYYPYSKGATDWINKEGGPHTPTEDGEASWVVNLRHRFRDPYFQHCRPKFRQRAGSRSKLGLGSQFAEVRHMRMHLLVSTGYMLRYTRISCSS